MLDLTDFGVWNDSLGRDVGDIILQAVAAALEGTARRGKDGARIGGDSFAILVQDRTPRAGDGSLSRRAESEAGRAHPAQRLGDRHQVPGRLHGREAGLTCRYSAQLLEQADIALRRARQSRHATSGAVPAGMNEDLVQRLAAEGLVREALVTMHCIASSTSRSFR